MLGIERPVERGERRQFSIIKLLKNVYYFLYVGVLYCWGFIIFVYEHRKHLEEAPMEMGVLSACFASTVQYIFLLSDTSKIWKLMEDFQAVVDKFPENYKIFYQQAEITGRRRANLILRGTIILLIVNVVFPMICSACYNIAVENYKTDDWFQPFQIVIPFERHTVIEYIIRIALHGLLCYNYFLIISSTLTFFINFGSLIEAGIQHIKTIFKDIDDLAEQHTQDNTEKINLRLIDVVRIQLKLLRFSENLSEIMSAPLFFHLICNILFSSCCLMTLENGIDEMSFRTTIGICGTFVGLFWIYVYCYIGNRITYNLLGIAVWAYRPAWHIYPLKLRVFIILIICRSQKVLNFNGLRLIFCNLVTFTSILRLICSYYLMLRNLH